MGYGTQPHDWELDELESMKGLLIVCLSVPHAIRVTPCYVVQPIVADQHECQDHQAQGDVRNGVYTPIRDDCKGVRLGT
jgi:hypothetical protein